MERIRGENGGKNAGEKSGQAGIVFGDSLGDTERSVYFILYLYYMYPEKNPHSNLDSSKLISKSTHEMRAHFDFI